MRRLSIGIALALAFAGAAQAADYLIVASTDPALARGAELDGGQRIPLGAGRTLTLLTDSGEVTTVRGAAGGVVLPRRAAPPAPERLATLKLILSPAPAPARTFGGRRGGVCPDPGGLTTIDQITAVQQAGCEAEARKALEAYLAKAAG